MSSMAKMKELTIAQLLRADAGRTVTASCLAGLADPQ